jgi:UTP--glucose-1-phosphate uridylyltransferase
VKKEKFELLNEIQDISKLANIHYIRQKEPLGLGHAIGCANRFIGDEPFAVLLGDDIVYSPEKPALKQLIDVYERYNSSVIGVQAVAEEDVSKYGVISIGRGEMEPGVFGIDDLVEKPKREEAPSNYAIMGRYILRPEIFGVLENLPSGAGGEIQLTDAIKRLNEQQMVVGCEFKGERHDVGDKFGFVRATVEFALMHGDLKENVYEYLKSVIERGRIGV